MGKEHTKSRVAKLIYLIVVIPHNHLRILNQKFHLLILAKIDVKENEL